jgi:hypothetical protein
MRLPTQNFDAVFQFLTLFVVAKVVAVARVFVRDVLDVLTIGHIKGAVAAFDKGKVVCKLGYASAVRTADLHKKDLTFKSIIRLSKFLSKFWHDPEIGL